MNRSATETNHVELRVTTDLREIPRQAWNALLKPGDNPFLFWDFLAGLEETGCVAPERRWWPCHLTAHLDGELIAAAPAYVKTDGMGDFSRDWGLAGLVQQLGGQLYPKLVVGIPFSPVTGRRVLVREGFDVLVAARMLMALAEEVAKENDLASIHVLYHLPEERPILAATGLSPRTLVQYHWLNHGYESHDDWLKSLRSKKRHQARRERGVLAQQEIDIRTVRGDELRSQPRQWADLAYELYSTTCDKYMWGGTYLNRRFYRLLFERLPEHVELVLATHDQRPIAGAINVATESHLFGRYWGCFEEHQFLHFNVCLYHSIEECIERGVQVFEGGAGGEHKRSRGFEPVLVHSSHQFLDPRLDRILGAALERETRARERELEAWREANPRR